MAKVAFHRFNKVLAFSKHIGNNKDSTAANVAKYNLATGSANFIEMKECAIRDSNRKKHVYYELASGRHVIYLVSNGTGDTIVIVVLQDDTPNLVLERMQDKWPDGRKLLSPEDPAFIKRFGSDEWAGSNKIGPECHSDFVDLAVPFELRDHNYHILTGICQVINGLGSRTYD